MTALYEAPDHLVRGSHTRTVGASQREVNECPNSTPAAPPSAQDSEVQLISEFHPRYDLTALRLLAEMFNDYQKQRIATGNRIDHGGIDQELFAELYASVKATEKMMGRTLVAEYKRSVPARIRAWQEATPGLGAHTFALLIGLLGDPRVAYPKHWENGQAKGGTESIATPPGRSPEDAINGLPSPTLDASRPQDKKVLVADSPYERSLSQLWAYCGVGDPTRRPRKGMSQEDTFQLGRRTDIGKVLHVIAEGCVKQRRSPYRTVYDEARVEYATRDGWTPLHQHNAAMRKVKKEVLRDLWIAAGEEEGHPMGGTQSTTAPISSSNS